MSGEDHPFTGVGPTDATTTEAFDTLPYPDFAASSDVHPTIPIADPYASAGHAGAPYPGSATPGVIVLAPVHPGSGLPVAYSPYDVPSARASHAPAPSQGAAITSLTLGIIALLLCWLPAIAMIPGFIAVICGIVAVRRRQSTAMAVWGICTGAFGLIMNAAATAMLVLAGLAVNAMVQGTYDVPRPRATGTPVTVEYVITSSSGGGTVVFTGADGPQTLTFDAARPFEATEQISPGETVTVRAAGDAGPATQRLSCQVLIDGRVFDEQTATGAVECRARVPATD